MDDTAIESARSLLLSFYDRHKRTLPWRQTRDPFSIWVSEVMLQQTRVETVIPYYQRFLDRFATVHALADADESEVLALWSGLGYYRRARMLHAGAKYVVRTHDGVLPASIDALKKIPGVGDYTAGAIASIAFDLREPVLDGNVERVLARLTALQGDPRAKPQRNELWSLARRFADSPRPGEVNQALMELGATVCTPTSPQCLLCPLRAHCKASSTGEPERYPEKARKKALRTEQWTAFVVRDELGQVWLGPAPSELERWKGMLLPPLVPQKERAPSWIESRSVLARVTHVLTHVRMEITVREGAVRAKQRPPSNGRFVAIDAFDLLAIPKVTRVILAAVEPHVVAQSAKSCDSTSRASSRKNPSMRARNGKAKNGSCPPRRT
jgi:A/G-specific adenine glycosylase